MMRVADLWTLLPHAQAVGDGEAVIQRVHTDTRTLRVGDLFVALRGERFDAHSFLPQAKAAGAVAVLASTGIAEAGLPGVCVEDTRQSLGELGKAWRAKHDLPLIVVTGSNGKTTVTQMIASILRAWVGENAFSTEGNFNNEIGVPLTLLRLRPHHRAAVVELGMNHPGEIAQLAGMAMATVALVNNAQREHQEFMKTVEAVALENGAAISALGDKGVAVFPADDAYTSLWRGLAGKRSCMTFSLNEAGDVRGHGDWRDGAWDLTLTTPMGQVSTRLAIAGDHNVKNALAACACALAAGCPLEAVARGLAAFVPVKGRSQVKVARWKGQVVTLIDDTYNANPDSMRAAIQVLSTLPAPRWLILGDMGEVGEQGPGFHREVGQQAKEVGLEAVWCVGELAAHSASQIPGARHFADVPKALATLAEGPVAKSVLVKGSRFMAMERIVEAVMVADPSAKQPN